MPCDIRQRPWSRSPRFGRQWIQCLQDIHVLKDSGFTPDASTFAATPAVALYPSTAAACAAPTVLLAPEPEAEVDESIVECCICNGHAEKVSSGRSREPHLTSSHPTSPHLTPPHPASPHLSSDPGNQAVIRPCGHASACLSCIAQVMLAANDQGYTYGKCPVCRAPITNLLCSTEEVDVIPDTPHVKLEGAA